MRPPKPSFTITLLTYEPLFPFKPFQIRQLPESVIVETTEYKCLQSQFSVLYNESMQIKTMLDETRSQLQTSKNQHLRQIEIMESEELIAQKKVRSEMIQMEDVLAQIRKEYEKIRIQYEQNLAANEQTAPINREMRQLITTMSNHHNQLKGEMNRYRDKYKEATGELMKLKKEYDELVAKLNATDGKKVDTKQEGAGVAGVKEESTSDGLVSAKEEAGGSQVKSKYSLSFLFLSPTNLLEFSFAFQPNRIKMMASLKKWMA